MLFRALLLRPQSPILPPTTWSSFQGCRSPPLPDPSVLGGPGTGWGENGVGPADPGPPRSASPRGGARPARACPLPLAATGRREIHVIDIDYEQYAILRVSHLWQGREFHVLKYFTRSLEGEYEPGFWRFRELTADTGLYLVARHGADLEEPRPQPGHWEPCPPGLSWRHLPPINAAAKPAAPTRSWGGEVRGVGVDKGEPGCPEASTRRRWVCRRRQ
ncbi:uncharacterized protein LOC125120547 isoform X2 [Phacochoerus africanus]|uniref:uncharacterized protein LOC125120547 isoform X2 n=1 Tax=Phacochoerus africanus TaxID=41426 RepID=UPI001FD8ECA8|nr:uncharacterized protein LOC125120547 isoform X2 [Phacochoerus africanus]